MSKFSSNAIITKAKAIYGRSLKANDYEELLRKKSVAEVASYLQGQESYAEILNEIQVNSVHRGQLEELIKKNIFNNTLKLIKFITLKDEGFYDLNIIKRENDLILATIRSLISYNFDDAIAEFPTFLIHHASFDLTRVSQSRTFNELLDSLKNTDYYPLLEPFRVENIEEINYVAIEHVLEEYYYDSAFNRINENYHGKVKKDLTNIYLTKIELNNIIKIYRLKKFYHADPETIENMLIKKYSRINKKKFDYLISLEDPDAILEYLETSEFSKFTDESEYVYVEYFAERIRYNLAKRYMFYSTNAPTVYSAFIILFEIELENLTNIIEGIRYQLAEEDIRKMLIY